MLAYIPLWVPLVLLLLLAIGHRQSRTRTVRPGLLVAIAGAMFALSLYGVVSAFGVTPVALVLWAAGYAAAVTWGSTLLSPRGMEVVGFSVRVPGSWAPLTLLLGIFAAKFALGFAAGVHSEVLHNVWFAAAMSGVLGTLSGGFGARAVAVQRFASTAGAA